MATWYFGSDSGTSTNPCGMSFYIGRMGYGTTVSIDWTVTNTSIPAFPYWNIVGPGDTPAGTTYQEWGAEQADVFWNQYWNQQYPGGTPEIQCLALYRKKVEGGILPMAPPLGVKIKQSLKGFSTS